MTNSCFNNLFHQHLFGMLFPTYTQIFDMVSFHEVVLTFYFTAFLLHVLPVLAFLM
jgi:hypothetical protein